MPKTVGILGGMGPEATAEFFNELVRLTPADRDQDHLPVIMLSDPRIPDRTEYVLGSGASFLPHLLRLARNLEKFGADLIVIPCNTAHLFWRDLSNAVQIPVLNIVEETVDEIERISPQIRQIGILATVGTLKSSLYQTALVNRGFVPLVPSEGEQRDVHQAIEQVKANVERKVSQQRIGSAVQSLRNGGAQGVILGCTELGLVGELSAGIPIFDSLKILAKAALREAITG